jgi:hypothetical protein
MILRCVAGPWFGADARTCALAVDGVPESP